MKIGKTEHDSLKLAKGKYTSQEANITIFVLTWSSISLISENSSPPPKFLDPPTYSEV